MENPSPQERLTAYLVAGISGDNLRAAVNLVIVSGIGAWLCIVLNLSDMDIQIGLVGLFIMTVFPLIVNYSTRSSYAVETVILSQITVYGLALLFVTEIDWQLLSLASALILGHVFLLRGMDSVSVWAGLAGLLWLPLSRLLNDETAFSGDILIPFWIHLGVFVLYISLTYRQHAIEQLTQHIASTQTQTLEIDRTGYVLLAEQLGETARQLDDAASTIHNITLQQAGRSDQQATVVSDAHVILNQFQNLSTQARNKAEYMTVVAQETLNVSEKGRDRVEAALQGMQQTRSSVELVGRTINQLALHLRRIGQIISSVSDIATQSNFLALNAQIEAARAGERGRGFTVVADEVRDLADQSRQSTSDVRSILKEIQRAVAEAVDVTEKGADGVNTSLHQAEEAGRIIGQLNDTIVSNNASSEAILQAIDRQMTDVNKLVESMQTLNQVAMQNQASSRMAETVSQNLSRLSAKLVGTILQAETEPKHSSQEMRGVE